MAAFQSAFVARHRLAQAANSLTVRFEQGLLLGITAVGGIALLQKAPARGVCGAAYER